MKAAVGRITLVYALSHFLVDFACAFVAWRYVKTARNGYQTLLLYNFCAFALQMPLGLVLDRVGNGKAFAALGCLVVAASLAFRGNAPAVCLVAGIGNALFHIGGGHDVLRQGGRRAAWLGAFVSPGAFGLFLGGLLGGGSCPVWPVPTALALTAAGILCLCPHVTGARQAPAPDPKGLALRRPKGLASRRPKELASRRPKGLASRRAGARPWLIGLVLLFLVVCLRSYGGFLFQFPWKKGAWGWAFVLSVVLGKTVGGWLYDRLGGAWASVGSLGLATALFFGSAYPVPGCLAVLLFNVTMPVTLRLMADLLRDRPAFSFGLLTLALFLGYLPVWLDWPAPSGNFAYAGVCLVSLALLLPVALRRFV